MPVQQVVSWLHGKYMTIYPELDERGRRRWAAMEARSLGWEQSDMMRRAECLSRLTAVAATARERISG
jgi:hypothetical protein